MTENKYLWSVNRIDCGCLKYGRDGKITIQLCDRHKDRYTVKEGESSHYCNDLNRERDTEEKNSDVPPIDNNVSAKKYDEGKDRWDLLPLEPIREVVKVFTFGASKYGQDQWQKLDNFEERYYAAALRHLSAWRLGEKLDQSGLHHLAHCAWNILALLWGELKK
jgi:hypothetical protein